MIALLREATSQSPASRQLARARRIVAAALLGPDASPRPGPLKSWRAWLAASWMCAVLACYVFYHFASRQ